MSARHKPGYIDHIGNSYFSDALHDPEKLRDNAIWELGRYSFDTLVGTGMSGALVLPILAEALDTYFLLVRKSHKLEVRHNYGMTEGRLGRRWLFVDDFMSTGRTAARVANAVNDLATEAGWRTTCVGAYFYQGRGRRGEYGRMNRADFLASIERGQAYLARHGDEP